VSPVRYEIRSLICRICSAFEGFRITITEQTRPSSMPIISLLIYMRIILLLKFYSMHLRIADELERILSEAMPAY
jgi:hypothetical protein